MKSYWAALALASLTTGLSAQEPSNAQTEASESPTASQPAPAQTPIANPTTTNAVLRAGTPITLRFLEEVTTKKKRARVGQRIKMEVAAPVEVNGVTVIPAGTPAEGEITSVRNKGMWGKSGHLEGRALYARVNGRQIRLTGTFDDKGVTGTAGVVAAIAFVPIAGFFTTGTSAVFPMGGEVPAFVDEDVELAFKATKPAPLQVGATAETAPMEVPSPQPEATPEGE